MPNDLKNPDIRKNLNLRIDKIITAPYASTKHLYWRLNYYFIRGFQILKKAYVVHIQGKLFPLKLFLLKIRRKWKLDKYPKYGRNLLIMFINYVYIYTLYYITLYFMKFRNVRKAQKFHEMQHTITL